MTVQEIQSKADAMRPPTRPVRVGRPCAPSKRPPQLSRVALLDLATTGVIDPSVRRACV